MNILTIHTDGGSRGNPGKAAWGFVAYDDAKKVMTEGAKYMGIATNNEAEYQGFLESVKWVLRFKAENAVEKILWKLDSLLVVEQLNKHWKIKEPRMAELAKQCWTELDKVSCGYEIKHVPRAENAAADALVNQALDSATLQ